MRCVGKARQRSLSIGAAKGQLSIERVERLGPGSKRYGVARRGGLHLDGLLGADVVVFVVLVGDVELGVGQHGPDGKADVGSVERAGRVLARVLGAQGQSALTP